MSFAFGNNIHIFFSATAAAAAGDTSGISISAAAGGRGVLVNRYEPEPAGAVVTGFKLTSAIVLDANLTTVTPTIVSEVGASLGTVIQTGQEAAGLLPSGADYIWRAASFTPMMQNNGIYIPPGQFLTLMAVAVNTELIASFGLIELG